MIWFEKDLEIRYADTDQMGVVHHAVYPLYCEIGRTFACAELGLPYHQLEAQGFYLMVADMYCRYRFPARYGEPIYVQTAISRLKKRLIEFQYRIGKRTLDHPIFTGTSKHIVTRGTEGSTSLPPEHLALLQKGLA